MNTSDASHIPEVFAILTVPARISRSFTGPDIAFVILKG